MQANPQTIGNSQDKQSSFCNKWICWKKNGEGIYRLKKTSVTLINYNVWEESGKFVYFTIYLMILRDYC